MVLNRNVKFIETEASKKDKKKKDKKNKNGAQPIGKLL